MRKIIRKSGFIAVVVLLALVAYYLYDTLRERTYTEKIAGIVHDEDARAFSSYLKKYLTDKNPKVRERAALAVGRIGAKGSGKLLFDLVNTDSSFDVAATAAFALGLTHEKQYALPLLDAALDYSLKENSKPKDQTKVESKIKLNSKVSAMAVRGASLLLDSSMVDAIDMLDGFLNHISPEVRQAACLAYARANAKNKGRVLMNFITKESDREVQVSALYALAHLSVKEAKNIYFDYFSDTDPFVRILSVRGLGLLDTPKQVHELTIALNDNNDKVVLQAIKELATKESLEARTKLVDKLQVEKDAQIISALIDALRQQQNPAGVEKVNDILLKKPSPNVIVAAVKYMATIQKDRSINLIDSLLTLDNQQIRAGCAEALGLLNSSRIISRLSYLLADKNVEVRASALRGLLNIKGIDLKFCLDKALSDSQNTLMLIGIKEIKEKKLSAYLPQLLTMMDVSSVPVRRMIVASVDPFIVANQGDTNANRILIKGITDKNYPVRYEAAVQYKKLLNKDYFAKVPPAKTKYSRKKIEKALKKYPQNPDAVIETNKGKIEVELLFDKAPVAVVNFIDLAHKNSFDSSLFTYGKPDFSIQFNIFHKKEREKFPYYENNEYFTDSLRGGYLGINTLGNEDEGIPLFITLFPRPDMMGRCPLFGKIISGQEVADNLVPGDTIKEVMIQKGKSNEKY